MKRRNELLIDLYNCKENFSKKKIKEYINGVCKVIKMKKHGKMRVWRDKRKGFEGFSAFQFIKTSSIVLHNFDKDCYIDIFSCKKFDYDKALKFTKNFFKAEEIVVRKI